jgi:hypothetical protein
MTQSKLIKSVLILLLSFAYTVSAYATPALSPQVIAAIEQARFLEMPFEVVKAQIIQKLVRGGYTQEQATKLASEILDFSNNSLKVSEIIGKFNSQLDKSSNQSQVEYVHLTPENVNALFRVSDSRHVLVEMIVREIEGADQRDAALGELKRQGALVEGEGYPQEAIPAKGRRNVTVRTRAQAQALIEILAEFQEAISSVRFTEVSPQSNTSKHLNSEVLAKLESVSATQYVLVSMHVIGTAEANKMDADLAALRTQGIRVEGQGFGLESSPPQGNRKVWLKNKQEVALFVKFITSNSGPVTSLEIKSEPAPAPAPAPAAPIVNDNNAFIHGSEWALNVVKGRIQNEDVVRKLRELKRILPYGRTLNGVRTETEFFRIDYNQDRMLFLYPTSGRLKLLFGAAVSSEMREAVSRNSVYLFQPGPGNEEFQALLMKIAQADKIFEAKFGYSALVKGQDPFNREIQLFGARLVATDLEINKDLSSRELVYFVDALNDTKSCGDFLK